MPASEDHTKKLSVLLFERNAFDDAYDENDQCYMT